MEERFKFLSPLLFEVVILTYCFIFKPVKFSPHQLEIPHISARMEHREKERTQYEFCAFARPYGIQPSGRFK